ncbi:MAG: SAM-dependent chlorinase/fluorinase [Ignavibacteriales bacterium]|nr:SAM-dependent chlorinase/fluorinase [Ignavibacteriales bacterium]MBI3788183.1 SAM-dependent chlorinase/fluorinase [Ignavibacteriales bacterium]
MSRSSPIVALLTDFGPKDQYVGVMKAAMLSLNPTLRFIDISHEVSPHNIREAGYLLWASYKYFPNGTIFLSVVDPGVGTNRKIIIARTKKYFFLAPDNDLLDFILLEENAEIREVILAKNLPGIKDSSQLSSTFHGRDVFAPVAALLSQGKDWEIISRRTYLEPPKRKFYDSRHRKVQPAILHVDGFGNIITNIVGRCVAGIAIDRSRMNTWISNYQSSPPNKPCLILGSSGLVEIVVKNGSAAQVLSASVNSTIRILNK